MSRLDIEQVGSQSSLKTSKTEFTIVVVATQSSLIALEEKETITLSQWLLLASGVNKVHTNVPCCTLVTKV